MSALSLRTAADRALRAGRSACGGLGMTTTIITVTARQRGANG